MKRIYWQTVLKKALLIGIPTVTGFGLLFWYLSALGVIDITAHSEDMVCAGTVEDPCLAYINFTAKEDIFIYPMDYDPWGRDTPFETDKELKSWKMYRSWGTGWREIKLNETCKYTWCGAPPNSPDNKYAFAFREGRDYQIRIVALKEDPTQDIKWGFGPVDPVWYGSNKYNVSFEFSKNSIIEKCLDIEIKNLQDSSDTLSLKTILNETNFDTNKIKNIKFYELQSERVLKYVYVEECNPYTLANGTVVNNCIWIEDGNLTVEEWNWEEKELITTDKKGEIKLRNTWENMPIQKAGQVKDTINLRLCFDTPIEKESGWGNSGTIYLDLNDELFYDKTHSSWWNSSYTYRRNITGMFEKVVLPINGTTPIGLSGGDAWIYGVGANSPALYYIDVETHAIANDTDEFWKVQTLIPYRGTTGTKPGNLTLFMPFDNAESGKAINYAGTNMTYTKGIAQSIDTGIGRSFKFDDTDLHITGAQPFSGEYGTMILRFQAAVVCGDGEQYVAHDTGESYYMGISDAGSLFFRVGGGAPATASCIDLWNVGDWLHIVITWDTIADEFYIYYNKTLFASDTTAKTAASNENLYIGNRGGTQYYTNGNFTQFTIYDRVLTSAEINATYDLATSLSAEETEVGVDIINPNVTINTPLNDTYNTATINFNVTALDEIAMSDCNYTLNSGLNNFTMANLSTSPTQWTATNSTMSEDGHEVFYHCWDTSGNLNDSESVSFSVSVSPEMTFDYPENISYNVEITNLNYTYVEPNPGYCMWSNDSGVTNSTPVTMGTNWTGLSSAEESNTWTLYCNDTLGNSNSTDVTFIIDTINPGITIIYPNNNTNHSVNTVDVNYTASDSGVGLASCWWSNDSMQKNTTLTNCGTNVTDVVWTEGQHNVTVWANDTIGNENSSSVTFNIDTINPDINITFPINNTNWTNVNLNVNFTRSDNIALHSCWYSNDTYLANTTLPNCGNITNVVWSYAQHNVTIWVNDTVGNENHSKISFTIFLVGENIPLRELELGSNVNITANTTLGFVCVDIDHPDYGINYSCLSDVNIAFNISFFRKTMSDGSLSLTRNYTNSSSFDVLYINLSSHQYDEADNLSLNISGTGNRDVAFYKVNTTDFDRVYMGYLIGDEIYLNKSCDSAGVGTCVGHYNLTFPNPGSQTVYFYIDDNIDIFNFTLNVSGDLYGFEFEDTFENDSYIDWDLTTTQLDSSGTIMPQNSSYWGFSYDDFEDDDINLGLWVKTNNFSDSDAGWSYSGEIQEDAGYIQLETDYGDPGNERADTSITLQLAPSPTPLNMYASDYIEFNLSNKYDSNEGSPSPACFGNLDIYAGSTLIWTSMFISSSINNPETSLAKRMKFRLTKINSTSWKCNITGEEYSKGLKPEPYEQWNNWTNGTWRVNHDGAWTYGTLNSTFYFNVNYGSSYYVLFDNTLRDAGDGCNDMTQTTKIYYVNNSKWSRTNGTVTSTSVFDSSGNIVDATLSLWGYILPSETIFAYLSADGGTNWESVTNNVKHTFSNPGKHIKLRLNFTNVSEGYLNLTSYITNIKINTTQSNPSNITLDFGDDKITNITLGGFLNSTNGSITLDLSDHNLTDSFTSRRSLYDHLYIIPLTIYSDSKGYVNLNTFNLTYNPNPVILNITSIQNFLDESEGVLNFSIPISTYVGNITIDDIKFDYAGGNETVNITVHTPDNLYLNQTNITLWYSRWDYDFVPKLDYLEFIPLTPTSKNVSAYGQTSNNTFGAILNLTNYGYGGRDINLSIYLNETLPCVNLTMSLNHNKSDGFLINDSWFNIQKLSYLDTVNFWMWADYECSYSTWHTFNPFIYFRQCCENCTCSEER